MATEKYTCSLFHLGEGAFAIPTGKEAAFLTMFAQQPPDSQRNCESDTAIRYVCLEAYLRAAALVPGSTPPREEMEQEMQTLEAGLTLVRPKDARELIAEATNQFKASDPETKQRLIVTYLSGPER